MNYSKCENCTTPTKKIVDFVVCEEAGNVVQIPLYDCRDFTCDIKQRISRATIEYENALISAQLGLPTDKLVRAVVDDEKVLIDAADKTDVAVRHKALKWINERINVTKHFLDYYYDTTVKKLIDDEEVQKNIRECQRELEIYTTILNMFNMIDVLELELTKERNLRLLDSFLALKEDWNDHGAEPFTPEHINFVKSIVEKLSPQPQIVLTAAGGIHLQYDKPNGDVMIFDIKIDNTIKFSKHDSTGTIEKEITLDALYDIIGEYK